MNCNHVMLVCQMSGARQSPNGMAGVEAWDLTVATHAVWRAVFSGERCTVDATTNIAKPDAPRDVTFFIIFPLLKNWESKLLHHFLDSNDADC